MRLTRNQTMRGLDGFFGDDDSSYDNYSYEEYEDNFSYPEFVETAAPDAVFTGQAETLEYSSPDEYFLPSASEVTPLSQGYTVDETPSGGSTMTQGYVSDNTDFQTGSSPYGDSRAGESSFIKDITSAIPTLFKSISEYDLKKMQLELDMARLQRGYLPMMGGKTVKAVRPDPTNPRARIVTYTDGTEARVPITAAGATSWQVPALFALGAAGLFFVLQKRKR